MASGKTHYCERRLRRRLMLSMNQGPEQVGNNFQCCSTAWPENKRCAPRLEELEEVQRLSFAGWVGPNATASFEHIAVCRLWSGHVWLVPIETWPIHWKRLLSLWSCAPPLQSSVEKVAQLSGGAWHRCNLRTGWCGHANNFWHPLETRAPSKKQTRNPHLISLAIARNLNNFKLNHF